MQRAGRLVPVAAPEFGQTQRQLAVASEPVAEDQYMAGAVHRLDREHPLVAAFGDEHVLAEVLPMARGFPQTAIEGPAFRVPENAADRLLTEVKEIELTAQPAMVTAFRFL